MGYNEELLEIIKQAINRLLDSGYTYHPSILKGVTETLEISESKYHEAREALIGDLARKLKVLR